MTTAAFVRLIFLKDVWRARLPLGMVLGLGLIMAFTLLRAGSASVSYVILLSLFPYLMGLFLAMDVIQIDSPCRELRFLSTRPVGGEAIFLAKILFLGLLLIIGGWGVQELDYASLNIPLKPIDHLCLLIETTIHSGTVMALVVLFTLFLRKNIHVVFALFLFLLTIPIVGYFSAIFYPDVAIATPERNHAQLCWGGLVLLLTQWGFIGIVLLAARVRYRSHKFGLPLALVIGGILLDFLVCVGIDKMGENRLAHDQMDNMPSNLREQIRLTNYTFPEQAEQTANWNGIIYHTVVRGPNVEGVEYPYYTHVVGQQSTATLRSGKVIHSITEPTRPRDSEDVMSIPFEAEIIGVNSAVPGVSYAKPGFTLRAFTYLSLRLPAGEDLTGVTIKGEVQLEIRRAYVAGSIPLESGAVFTQSRQRYEITKVSSSPADIFLNLAWVKLPLILRGDTGSKSENLSWALVSRSRNEILQSGSGGASSINFPIEIATSHMIYSKPGNNAFPPDWLKGAELVFLGNETCGQVTVPYQINDVTLTR